MELNGACPCTIWVITYVSEALWYITKCGINPSLHQQTCVAGNNCYFTQGEQTLIWITVLATRGMLCYWARVRVLDHAGCPVCTTLKQPRIVQTSVLTMLHWVTQPHLSARRLEPSQQIWYRSRCPGPLYSMLFSKHKRQQSNRYHKYKKAIIRHPAAILPAVILCVSQ